MIKAFLVITVFSLQYSPIKAQCQSGTSRVNQRIDIGCGAPSIGCQYRCPFGFPCSMDNDCISGSCTSFFCDVGKPAGFSNVKKPTIPAEKPPIQGSANRWSTTSIKSLSDFGHIIKVSYGSENQEFVPDPTGAGGSVIKIRYPAGSYKPSASPVGGTGFYADPIDLSSAKTVTLSYKVFFPLNFNFVKGGKLPGLFGGRPGCSGGSAGKDCFSTRFMFRKGGLGELYVYLDDAAQVPAFCQIPPSTECNPVYGSSIGRGAFTFATGQWTTVSQTITLNTIGKNDGKMEVSCNGKVVISFNQVAWQPKNKIPFVGIQFETFFGGSDASWASTGTQYSFYKDFSIIAQ